jgi:hypothetical protein
MMGQWTDDFSTDFFKSGRYVIDQGPAEDESWTVSDGMIHGVDSDGIPQPDLFMAFHDPTEGFPSGVALATIDARFTSWECGGISLVIGWVKPETASEIGAGNPAGGLAFTLDAAGGSAPWATTVLLNVTDSDPENEIGWRFSTSDAAHSDTDVIEVRIAVDVTGCVYGMIGPPSLPEQAPFTSGGVATNSLGIFGQLSPDQLAALEGCEPFIYASGSGTGGESTPAVLWWSWSFLTLVGGGTPGTVSAGDQEGGSVRLG